MDAKDRSFSQQLYSNLIVHQMIMPPPVTNSKDNFEYLVFDDFSKKQNLTQMPQIRWSLLIGK